MSLSGFSRKVGYSRQYSYELLKTREADFSRKIQPDTLKRICDERGYSLERSLVDIGYIPKLKDDIAPNTITVGRKGREKAPYLLSEHTAALIESRAKSLVREKD